MIIIAVIILGILIIILAGMLLRTARFLPEKKPQAVSDELDVDVGKAAGHLQKMVRCRTVSAQDLRDEAEFEKFRALLPCYYPALFSAADVQRVDTTGILFHIEGREQGRPVVFLGHYDVVPADASKWLKPPFEGILEDGVLWGRGALDMKNQLCTMLEAIEYLLEHNFKPKHDIYIALSGEEEIMGSSAASMRDVLKNAGIRPAFVMDEGGDIIDGFFPGVSFPCATIGIGEKGVSNIYFTATSKGGHASVPTKNNPLLHLCRAMCRVNRHPFRCRPGSALNKMVDVYGRYCSFGQRFLFANRDVLYPFYIRWIRKQGGMIEAAARTTCALTQTQGASAGNQIPTEAYMFANFRVMSGDSEEKIISRLNKMIHDPAVSIRANPGTPPCADSLMTDGYEQIRAAIAETWPEAVTAPYQMVACTDSRHWREICDNVYRFSAKYVTGEEKATVHGNNERIRVENIENSMKFFIRLMRTL